MEQSELPVKVGELEERSKHLATKADLLLTKEDLVKNFNE